MVCSTCSPDLAAAKTSGIHEAMRRLITYCGADAPAEICPITFHLDRDEAPVSVTINNQSPGFVFVSTGLEPVGEGES